MPKQLSAILAMLFLLHACSIQAADSSGTDKLEPEVLSQEKQSPDNKSLSSKSVNLRPYVGHWKITYSIGTIREYDIQPDGSVSFQSENLSGSLLPHGQNYLLNFSSDGKKELLSLNGEFVTVFHFDPASRFPNNPSCVGMGTRIPETDSTAQMNPDTENSQQPNNQFQEITGSWKIEYTIGTVRTYFIKNDGSVFFGDENRTGTLLKDGDSYVLDFGDNKKERLKFKKDKVTVQHFDPESRYPSNPSCTGKGERQ